MVDMKDMFTNQANVIDKSTLYKMSYNKRIKLTESDPT